MLLYLSIVFYEQRKPKQLKYFVEKTFAEIHCVFNYWIFSGLFIPSNKEVISL